MDTRGTANRHLFFHISKMTYAVDVHRGVHPPLKKVTDLALYILMFPQLIAGPIVRFNEIADQLVDRRHNENVDNRLTGFFRFAVGLVEVMIANPLGAYADSVLPQTLHNWPPSLYGLEFWLMPSRFITILRAILIWLLAWAG